MGCANTSVVASQLPSSESGKNIWTWWHFSVTSADGGGLGLTGRPAQPIGELQTSERPYLNKKKWMDKTGGCPLFYTHFVNNLPKRRKVRRLASTTEGRGREMVADRKEKQERRRGREKLSLAFSSEEMVSLSLEIKLHTCSMPRLRNSSLSTTSAKCRSVGKPERDYQHHTSEEATSLDQPEMRKCHRISSG